MKKRGDFKADWQDGFVTNQNRLMDYIQFWSFAGTGKLLNYKTPVLESAQHSTNSKG